MKDTRRIFKTGGRPSEGVPENMIRTPQGELMPIPRRNRRGRKSRRKESHPLRDIRLSRGMTLEELAEVSNLSPSYLSRLESGSRRLNVDTINKLSEALNCDAVDLLPANEQWEQRPANTASYAMPAIHHLPHRGPYNPSVADKMPVAAAMINQQIPLFEADPRTDIVDFSAPMCHIPAPGEIANVPGAYAFTVSDQSMAPRMYCGDRLLVNPGKPLSPRATALVVLKNNKVVIGEFVAWRHAAELNLPTQVTDVSNLPHAEEYILELRQYNAAKAIHQGIRETSGSDGQVLIYNQDIASIGRVIGMVEA